MLSGHWYQIILQVFLHVRMYCSYFEFFEKEALRIFIHCWWECKLVPPLWKTVWDSSKKLRMELRYNPAIPLLHFIQRYERSSPKRYTHLYLCLSQPCSQQLRYWSNLSKRGPYQWMNGRRRCSILCKGLLLSHRKDEILPFGQHGWPLRLLCQRK